MLGFAWFYATDTKRPVERPEKFFVTGVITSKRKINSDFPYVYYEIKLNSGKYKCYVSKLDFERLKPGNVVQCERLNENSMYADRVLVVRTV
jgi:hypothetical protein